VGAKHGGWFFFGRLDKNEGYKKHGKAGKSLKKLGKRGGCFEFID
jgi:hypothetical protein